MKTINRMLLLALLALLKVDASIAQEASETEVLALTKQVSDLKEGDSHFMMVGLVTMGFVSQTTDNTLGGIKTTSKYNSMGDADRFEFSPMFLWRHGDKLLAEFEPSYAYDAPSNSMQLGVNWADVSYYAAPGLIIRGGYLVLPFGTYTKRLAAGWINKLPSDPMGVDMAGSDFGFEAEGGFPLGKMKWSYDVSLSNGFALGPDGQISGVGINAISRGKTACGRLALLPIPNSSLEIGVSGLMGGLATPVGDTNIYNSPSVSMYAVDLNFVKNVKPLQINFKGQYSTSNVNNQNFSSTDPTQPKYTFNNTTATYFAQLSVRPSQLKNKTLKKMELAFRYVDYKAPEHATWGQNYSEVDVSLDYWISWRTVLKVGYENIKSDGTTSLTTPSGLDGTSSTINRLIIQFSTEL